MRITDLSLTDIGPFDRLQLQFPKGTDETRADTVVIVGPNGSGKSTLLYAIAGCLYPSADLGVRMRSQESTVTLGLQLDHQQASSTVSRTAHELPAPAGQASWPTPDYLLTVPRVLTERAATIGQFVDSAPLIYAYAGTNSVLRSGSVDGTAPEAGAPQFEKQFSFETFTAWAADVMGRRDSAILQGSQSKADEIAEVLNRMETFLSAITGTPATLVRNLDNGAIELRSASGDVPLPLLPEGLKSILCWVGDLLRRLYSLTTGGVANYKLPIVLLLDEIDIHLHPKWQRLILPALEQLLPNAQIFLTTHSPFVIGSATDTQIVWLDEGGVLRTDAPSSSLRGYDYTSVLELMGIRELSDVETPNALGKGVCLSSQAWPQRTQPVGF